MQSILWGHDQETMGIIMGMGIIIDEFKDINYSLDFLCLHMGIAMGINYLMKLM